MKKQPEMTAAERASALAQISEMRAARDEVSQRADAELRQMNDAIKAAERAVGLRD
jgi:hypothetical protein